MKKLIFLLATVLFSIGLINANETSDKSHFNTYRNGESFNFVQNNIHFQVFQNGEFDFFMEPENFTAANYNHGNVSITFNSGYNYDAFIQYDSFGAIIQIENTPIFYDYYGRISRIGDTRIRYNNRRLVQFGSMFVHYNNFGYFNHYSGYINGFNRHRFHHPYFGFFVRPVFNFCVVSYNPYRRFYTPLRHRFNSHDFRRSARIRSNQIANNTYSRRSISRRVEVSDRPARRSVATSRSGDVRNSRSAIRNTRGTVSSNRQGSDREITNSRSNISRQVVSSNRRADVSKPNTRLNRSVSTTRVSKPSTRLNRNVSTTRVSKPSTRSSNRSVSSNRKSVSNKRSVSSRKPSTVRKSKGTSNKRISQNRSSQKRQTTSRRRS